MGTAPRPEMPGNAIRDLLLEDYRYCATLLTESEKAGETRVNLLITLAVLVVGGLVSLATADRELPRSMVIVLGTGSLLALLAFGWLTLLRMIKRNERTDAYKHALDLIRQKVKDHFDADGVLAGYYPLNGPAARKDRNGDAGDHSPERRDGHRGLGGLTSLVAAINAVLAGALMAAVTLAMGHQAWIAAVLAGAPAGTLAFVLQMALVAGKENKVRDDLARLRPTHAGGPVCREEEGRMLILLVRPKRNDKDEWVLPKGHIRKHEGHGECALREVLEETGATARVTALLGEWRFMQEGKEVRMKAYLMRWTEDRGPGDGRAMRWCTIDEALGSNMPVEAREMLRAAERILDPTRAVRRAMEHGRTTTD